MKVATITFHWASNFGAVLQTYALQEYLKEQGYQTEVIDYVPKRALKVQMFEALKNRDIYYFLKRRELRKFISKYVDCTSHRYSTNRELINAKLDYDAVICGSDQIWNPSFTLGGEGKITLSYFLNFLNDKVKKIGYAVSFGTDIVNKNYISAIGNSLNFFDAISVREQSGIDILSQFNKQAILVCDPTLLLKRNVYERLIQRQKHASPNVYSYILHGQNVLNQGIIADVCSYYGCKASDSMKETSDCTVWLNNIKNAKMVVTNSFHGVMFSLIFNTPFIALPVAGYSMNNRIQTVLDIIGLSHRFLKDNNTKTINELCIEDINWNSVNFKLLRYADSGRSFLNKQLNDDKNQ